ncbi:MAG: hypothetical protein ACLPXB_13365 [Thiobacillaceae bacterium]
MNESIDIEIQFKPEADSYLAEIDLLESILPEIIHAMIEAEAELEAQ